MYVCLFVIVRRDECMYMLEMQRDVVLWCVHVCIYVLMCICKHVCMFVYVYMYAYMHVRCFERM